MLMMIVALHFNASLAELQRAGESLENLAGLEGGGYVAALGVYHELHCLVSDFMRPSLREGRKESGSNLNDPAKPEIFPLLGPVLQ
jgi:hypothetical protein